MLLKISDVGVIELANAVWVASANGKLAKLAKPGNLLASYCHYSA